MTDPILTTLRRDSVLSQVTIFQALELVGVSLVGEEIQQVVCPFHADRHPSARVYADHLYCFTCGRGWNAVEVLQTYFQVPLDEALDLMEGQFTLTPASVGLAETMRVRVKTVTPTLDPAPLVAYVETVLVEARDQMVADRYHRFVFALDALAWKAGAGHLEPAVYCADLRKVLTRLGSGI